MKKIRLKPAPNFKKWASSYMFCVKKELGDPEYSDDVAQYTYGFTKGRQRGQFIIIDKSASTLLII